jgi:hypothetical protein
MPNWCSNHLTITHEDPEKLQAVANAYNQGAFLKTLLPYPKELDIVAGSFSDPLEQEQHRVLEQNNRDAYGYSNWYDYCVNEWGTKWDFGKEDHEEPAEVVDGQVVLSFDTAWSPPIAAMEKLEELGYTVSLKYYEPGMAFVGHYSDGDDDYYEYTDMSSSEVREQLPEELDDFFGVSEYLAECEADEEADDQYE